MDTNSIVALATTMATERTQQATQLAVLRKALDLQGQGAIQLLMAAAKTTQNPPHLGNRIDTYA